MNKKLLVKITLVFCFAALVLGYNNCAEESGTSPLSSLGEPDGPRSPNRLGVYEIAFTGTSELREVAPAMINLPVRVYTGSGGPGDNGKGATVRVTVSTLEEVDSSWYTDPPEYLTFGAPVDAGDEKIISIPTSMNITSQFRIRVSLEVVESGVPGAPVVDPARSIRIITVDPPNTPIPPKVSFSPTSAAIQENTEGSFNVTVQLDRPPGGAASIGVRLKAGASGTSCGSGGGSRCATSGSDYILTTPLPQTLNFNDSNLSRTVSLSVQDDNLRENDEVVSLELYNPVGGIVLDETKKEFHLTIRDDAGDTQDDNSTGGSDELGLSCSEPFGNSPATLSVTGGSGTFFWRIEESECDDTDTVLGRLQGFGRSAEYYAPCASDCPRFSENVREVITVTDQADTSKTAQCTVYPMVREDSGFGEGCSQEF